MHPPLSGRHRRPLRGVRSAPQGKFSISPSSSAKTAAAFTSKCTRHLPSRPEPHSVRARGSAKSGGAGSHRPHAPTNCGAGEERYPRRRHPRITTAAAIVSRDDQAERTVGAPCRSPSRRARRPSERRCWSRGWRRSAGSGFSLHCCRLGSTARAQARSLRMTDAQKERERGRSLSLCGTHER